MKKKLLHLLPLLIALLTLMVSCENVWNYLDDIHPGDKKHIKKFCVISDPHYFSPELLIKNGTAFQMYLAQDRKMLAESKAILKSALAMIKAEKPGFVMIPGDLTKDGERISHKELAALLADLERSGIKVYVCPGNHDINNPHALSFDGDNVYPVESVTPEAFKKIYADFGYGEAIYSDPNSLSYVAKPVEGIWVLSMDVCQYQKNTSHPTTAGAFSIETLKWVKSILAQAKDEGILVYGMMHHGMMEHFPGQKTLFSEYVIDDWASISDELMEAGLEFVFTGHFHAQDIVKKEAGSEYLYDIETGSLVTYPCPVRVAYVYPNQKMYIQTENIKSINYDLGGAKDFQSYAYNFLNSGLDLVIPYMLMNPPYSLPQPQAAGLTPAVKEAMIAHYAGDEPVPSVSTQAVIEMLLAGDPLSQMLGRTLLGIFNDPLPADNNVLIYLSTGVAVD
jgi:3',5'-cyclic AMP phosphodiesterase CpdA